MNSHLSKPISIVKLATTIAQYWDGSASRSTNQMFDKSNDSESIYLQALKNNDEFNIENTIFYYVDENAHQRMINAFISEYKTKSEQCDELLAQWSTDKKLSFCHSLKGSAGNIGATKLQQLASSTEAHLKEEPSADMMPLFNMLQTIIDFLHELQVMLDDKNHQSTRHT
ncbi:Hpt domain-containing protein [Colwelliaceae bacterium 6441]